MQDRVGRVVQHLSHDFPPDSLVLASLDLHQRGDAVLVEQQVIDVPVVTRKFIGGNPGLSLHQQLAARIC